MYNTIQKQLKVSHDLRKTVHYSINAMDASRVEKKLGINSLNICDTTQKKGDLGLSQQISIHVAINN